MARKTHPDLEFAVEDASGRERTFKTFDEAAGFAVSIAASTGRDVAVDALAWSRAAAKFYHGDYGAEEYDADPDASVFDRVVISAEHVGRVY